MITIEPLQRLSDKYRLTGSDQWKDLAGPVWLPVAHIWPDISTYILLTLLVLLCWIWWSESVLNLLRICCVMDVVCVWIQMPAVFNKSRYLTRIALRIIARPNLPQRRRKLSGSHGSMNLNCAAISTSSLMRQSVVSVSYVYSLLVVSNW